MLRVLLVEDEQKDLQLLKKLIPWDELGLVFSGAAEDGRLALDMDEQIHPDIVITDIVLPHQDGVTLAQQIRKRRRDVHILLVSGHQDFQYARSAITAEVDAYILKPIREEELRQVLEKVTAQCIADKRSFYEKNLFQQQLRQQMPQLRDLFLRRWITSPEPEPQLFQDQLEFYHIPVPVDRFCVLVLSHDDPEIKTDEYSRQRICLELQNSIQQLTAERKMACCFWEDSRDCVILTGCETEEPYPELAQFAGQLVQQAGLLYGISMTAGIGIPVSEYGQAPESYRTALAAVEDRFFAGKGQVIIYHGVSSKDGRLPPPINPCHEALIQAVLCGNQEEIQMLTRRWMQQLSQVRLSAEMLRCMCIELLSAVITSVGTLRAAPTEAFLADASPYETLLSLGTLQQITEQIEVSLCTLSRFVTQSANDRYIAIVSRIQSLVEEEMDQGLTVEIIADKINLSRGYTAKIFYQVTGEYLNRYLIQQKIARAKGLLRNSDLKIHEIARQVGYDSAPYFSAAFKNETGMLPREYRDNCHYR